MDYNSAVDNLMQDVIDGTDEPKIIYCDNHGKPSILDDVRNFDSNRHNDVSDKDKPAERDI